MADNNNNNNNNSTNNSTSLITDIFNGNSGIALSAEGTSAETFALNLATGAVLFILQVSGFLLLKNSSLGRRLYQPKTYLVQERLRVEAIPASPLKWIRRIFSIKGEELKAKCGLDGYFAIRFLRAMIVIFLPLMVIIVTILLPINYHGGRGKRTWIVEGQRDNNTVSGLDTLSWQNVPPPKTDRYWAHLVCALLVISWTLWRIYREKLHYIKVRLDYLTSPEHRLKASARTILVTNIPSEYRSEAALKALFDVFIDNDDRSKLHVWVNRDYKTLKTLIQKRRKYCNTLEKEELRILRLVEKRSRKMKNQTQTDTSSPPGSSTATAVSSGSNAVGRAGLQRTSSETATKSPRSAQNPDGTPRDFILTEKDSNQTIMGAFRADEHDKTQAWRSYLKDSDEGYVAVTGGDDDNGKLASSLSFKRDGRRKVPKAAWLRAEICRLTVEIEELLPQVDDEALFPLQNSAFVQFERQMAANMAVALTAHDRPGLMSPRFLHVAPHEVIWPNMGLTSRARFVRTCIALGLFVGMLILWAPPAFFIGTLSQLNSVKGSTSWLLWLEDWPPLLLSFISGPLAALLLALLIQLVVPALCRKLAVLVGAPTRSRREHVTQAFYFTFLFIELVLVTSISSGIFATLDAIIDDPVSIPGTLATNLPKAANYFFNYLIIQGLAFSGSLLFQYLRVLFISLIWPWFTQTPRQEAWLQTTIPHQMWANVFCIWTNFAAIGLIYSVIAPLMLIFISAVFGLFWIAYRHNYYYVQRNKVDTHGQLFYQALSQLMTGIYTMEITLIGLFFLVRNADGDVACTPQAIIMIVALILTAAYHYVMERLLLPLYDLLPVTLEDKATDRERQRFRELDEAEAADGDSTHDDRDSEERLVSSQPHDINHMGEKDNQGDNERKHKPLEKGVVSTAANARRMMLRMQQRVEARIEATQEQISAPARSARARKMRIADELGASIARYPDELIDLSPAERDAEVRAAYQDPITREPAPVIWIPQDAAGCSEDMVQRAKKYGPHLQYSNAGAYLTPKGKCQVTQPAPDVRSDWLLDWVL